MVCEKQKGQCVIKASEVHWQKAPGGSGLGTEGSWPSGVGPLWAVREKGQVRALPFPWASTVPVGFGEFSGRPHCASFLGPSECIMGVCQSS